MKLSEALRSVAVAKGRSATRDVFLACGFEPLHLVTFLQAHFAAHDPARRLDVRSGVYGDLEGNLERAAQAQLGAVCMLIEWADLDPRLGLRSSGSWSGPAAADIVANAAVRLERLVSRVAELAKQGVVVVARPSLALPLVGHTHPWALPGFELDLQHMLSNAWQRLAALPRVSLLHPTRLDELSPVSERHDPRSELLSGFPYRLPHASVLAQGLVTLLFPESPKKGIITDLDDTLWAGLVGEVGPDAVAWGLDGKAQMHGLYQSTLAELAEAGAMLAVASKNELAPVHAALLREDLRLDRNLLFPVCASWGPKSDMVSEILARWNIAASDVVFVDDSPLELAEVSAVHPELTGYLFRGDDPTLVLDLCRSLRELFGKPSVSEEDRLRARSQANVAHVTTQLRSHSPESFLSGLEGKVSFDRVKRSEQRRAFELVNKTNQFNLNGARFSESEWLSFLAREDSFLWTVSYADRFGSLGVIGAVGGIVGPEVMEVSCWVLSCRAFSRRIEHHMLYALWTQAAPRELALAYRVTSRNQLVGDWLRELRANELGGLLHMPGNTGDTLAQLLVHEVLESGHA